MRTPYNLGALKRMKRVGTINGHQLYLSKDGVSCLIWTPGAGFQGWYLDKGFARVAAQRMAPVAQPKKRRQPRKQAK